MEKPSNGGDANPMKRTTIAKKVYHLFDNVLCELHYRARENAQKWMDCLKVWGKSANFVYKRGL
ncbi:MAG: hypothetical protein AB8W37_09230 [Arsenophonus endosymbiont of Dermacentor nuttalli]